MPQNGKAPGQAAPKVDLERLLKLRVLVARFGELDIAKWWNSNGQLGPLGTAALRRGFPRTYSFAQARSVFAVAAHRCNELFEAPRSVTLWRLPEVIEQEFEARWEHWLDNAGDWTTFFHSVEKVAGPNLLEAFRAFNLVDDRHLTAYSKLRRSSEGRNVPISGAFVGTDDEVTMLALGFARGEMGVLAVPYMSEHVA